MNQFLKFCAAMAVLFAGIAAVVAFVPIGHALQVLRASVARELPANGVISAPGEYFLAANRNNGGASSIISITASDVVLDLRGRVAQCGAPSSAAQVTTGIVIAGSNVTVRNGRLLGCVHALSVSASNVTIEGLTIHARYIGVAAVDDISDLTIRGNEFYDISGSTELIYAIGVNRPGDNCLIERNVFRNLHRQAGAPAEAAGEGVAVIFSPKSTGCVARQNWHENANMGHLEIGYWVGTASVTVEENTITNVGRAIAISPGVDADVQDNRFYMREPQAGSYAIGAQQGVATGNVMIGYDEPLLGNIPDGGNATFP